MVVALVARNTTMESPAATAAGVLIVTGAAVAVAWPRSCTRVMLA
jgi:hypothetical protein